MAIQVPTDFTGRTTDSIRYFDFFLKGKKNLGGIYNFGPSLARSRVTAHISHHKFRFKQKNHSAWQNNMHKLEALF